MISILKKWWPSILPGIVALWGVYGTAVQQFVSGHPAVAGVVAAAYAIFAHIMPSPTA